MKARTTLKGSLRPGSFLLADVKAGLQAFESAHVKLVAESERARVGDGLDLDEATRKRHPQDNRWDYVVSVPDVGKLVGIETHSMIDSQIETVIRKKIKSKEILDEELRPGSRVSEWIWVASGRFGLSRTDKARRRLDQHGITFTKRVVSLGS